MHDFFKAVKWCHYCSRTFTYTIANEAILKTDLI